jgi:hypothetical protein
MNYRLDVMTFVALNILGGEPIELMCLLYIRFIQVFSIIVAESAWKEFLTLFTPLLARSLIVLAAFFHYFILLPICI